jgi:hypothetical protein
MDLMSGLIGAIVGSAIVILWQSFTDARADRRAVTLEALDNINEMRILLKDIYDIRERNSQILANVGTVEDWRQLESQLFRLIYSAKTRISLRLIYGNDIFSREYTRIGGGLLVNAYRVMPRNVTKEKWFSSIGEYQKQMSDAVAPAVDAFEATLEESCRASSVFWAICVSIVIWFGSTVRELFNDR